MCATPSLSEALVKDDFVTQRSSMSRAKGSIQSYFWNLSYLCPENSGIRAACLLLLEHHFIQLTTKVHCVYDFHCPRQFIKMSPSLICMHVKDAFVIVGVG